MEYEPGVFDIRSGFLRPTALASLIKSLTSNQNYCHPALYQKGWWHRESRFTIKKLKNPSSNVSIQNDWYQPLLVIGKTGTLGYAFSKICTERSISYKLLGRDDVDIRYPPN